MNGSSTIAPFHSFRRPPQSARHRGRQVLFLVLLELVVAGTFSCAVRNGASSRPRFHVPLALFDPANIETVALLPPRDLTPAGEGAVRIEEALTGTVIKRLSGEGSFQLSPGHLPGSLDFVRDLRTWLDAPRRAPFPHTGFEALVNGTPCDAYLVIWIDRSSRPWMANEALENVLAHEFIFDATATLMSQDGEVFWSVRTKRRAVFQPGELPGTAKAAVNAFTDRMLEAFRSTRP